MSKKLDGLASESGLSSGRSLSWCSQRPWHGMPACGSTAAAIPKVTIEATTMGTRRFNKGGILSSNRYSDGRKPEELEW